MSIKSDNRQVVLLKSDKTGNRFYTLVEADSGLENSGTIEEFPHDLPLGIAYPCLEDGLNDFAVIRTTFETIEVVGDDPELRQEMMEMIDDARAKLVLRLKELRDRLATGQAHFLGAESHEFKDALMNMVYRGGIRKTLDNMMKLDVFESVARHETTQNGGAENPMYHYQFLPKYPAADMRDRPPEQFVSEVFDDVLGSVENDSHYVGRASFDREVFQKFIAVMFVNYATTDPEFYGTNRADYGVSSDKDMGNTPLYQAVGRALRELEHGYTPTTPPPRAGEPTADEDLSHLFVEASEDGQNLEIPTEADVAAFGHSDYEIIEPLSKIREGLQLLEHWDHPHADNSARLIRDATRQLFEYLQKQNVISPLAANPLADEDED